MPYVDKFKIDSETYIIKDTEGRDNTDKKLDKATNGNASATSTGTFTIGAGTTLSLRANNKTVMTAQSNGNSQFGNTGAETVIAGTSLGLATAAVEGFSEDFDAFPFSDKNGAAHKFAVLKNGAKIVKPSPRSIEEFQTLKKDGSDDITATLNTYTKQFPLFIPVGVYKISAPVQLKHSLYGAASSRDPARGSSDTILQYTDNPTAFGSRGVITVSGDDVTGNIVIANFDIICNGMIGGIVFTTNKYTDNYIYNVSIGGVKSYGVYLQPANSTLNRYCYMDNVTVWGFSDVYPTERVSGNVAFYWGDKAPDCECNNLLAMVCQTGFDCRTNVFGCNWITYNGIPSGGSGGVNANTWWDNTIGLKVTNNDVHITNLYIDTCRRGIVFDGPGKAAAYINNLIYTVDDSTSTTGEGNAAIALIGTSPSPQLTVDGGVINRTSKVSTTVQTIGTYPVTAMMCKINNAYIYTKREYIFSGNNQYICKVGEHRCIDLAITDQTQYTIAGQVEEGNPVQYKAFAYIPLSTANVPPAQGSIRVRDQDDVDVTVYLSINAYAPNDFICAVDNRNLYKTIAAAGGGEKTIKYNLDTSGQNKIYYVKDNSALILYAARPASYSYTVTCEGFNTGLSPVILDRIRNTDGTPMDFPRWLNADGLTPIKVLIPTIS